MKILYWTLRAFFKFELRSNIVLTGLTSFFIILSSASFAASGSKVGIGAEMTNHVLIDASYLLDSTSVQKAEADLKELGKYVSLTKAQEEVVYRLFLGSHLYLDNHEPAGERWELTMRSHLARFRMELGEQAFLQLADKGLVKKWFGGFD